MDKSEVVAIILALLALIVFSLRQDRKPRSAGQTTMIPWLFVGVMAGAAEFVMFYYAVFLFTN